MSLFREKRDAFPVPPIPPNSQAGFGSIRRVDLSRAESSTQKVAVYAAVNLLASLVAELGEHLDVFSGSGGTRTKVPPPRWFVDIGGSGYGTPDWLYQVVWSAALRGNVVGLIGDRDTRTGQPSLIDLVHPDDVSLTEYPQDTGRPATWRVRGKEVSRDQIWHKRRNPIPGRTFGLSPISLHATTIGLGLAAQNFGAQWFLDGAHPSAILTNDRVANIDKTQAATVKERFIAAVRGTREPVVLGGGWKYQQIQIAPGESQFLETQKYTAAECARIFGPGMPEVLGYETGGSMTYANIEQRSVDLLQYTFDPWLVWIEGFLSALLPRPWYARFNRKALLQTDIMTRYEAYRIALYAGFHTINEVRDDEDLAPVEWGNEPFLPAMQFGKNVVPTTAPGPSKGNEI